MSACPKCGAVLHSPENNFCMNCGWSTGTNMRQVVTIRTLFLTMKSGRQYALTIDDPRITGDAVMMREEVVTKEGDHIRTDEVEHWREEVSTTVMPDSPEGLPDAQ